MVNKDAVKHKAAISQVVLSMSHDTPFEDIVAVLKEALTIPELPGIRGCRPCLTGLDRFIIEDPAINRIR